MKNGHGHGYGYGYGLVILMLMIPLASAYVYQENANSTRDEPGNGPGWDTGHNATQILDGKWNTYGSDGTPGGLSSKVFMNYSRPTGTTGALWQVKDERIANITLTSSCWNNSVVQLEVESIDGGSSKLVQWFCNGVLLRSNGPTSYTDLVYEEGIFWSYINPVVIYLNGTNANITVTYPHLINFTCESNASVSLYVNDSSVLNESLQDLHAGYWNFSCNNSDGVQQDLFVNITKASSSVILSLNTSLSITVADDCEISCDEAVGLEPDFFMNSIPQLSPKVLSPPTAGTYLFACNYSGDENYTSSSSVLTLVVSEVPVSTQTGIERFIGAFAVIGIGIIIAKSYFSKGGGKK